MTRERICIASRDINFQEVLGVQWCWGQCLKRSHTEATVKKGAVLETWLFWRCNVLAIPGRSPFHFLLSLGMCMGLQACASLGRSGRYLFQYCLASIIYMLNTRRVLSTVFFKQALSFWQQPGSSLWLQSTGSSAGTAEGLTSFSVQGTSLVSCRLKGRT